MEIADVVKQAQDLRNDALLLRESVSHVRDVPEESDDYIEYDPMDDVRDIVYSIDRLIDTLRGFEARS